MKSITDQAIKNCAIYEVVKDKEDAKHIHLFGPLPSETLKLSSLPGYILMQIVNGKTIARFREDEVLFQRKPL